MSKARVRWYENGKNCVGYVTNEDRNLRPAILMQVSEEGDERPRPAKKLPGTEFKSLPPGTELFPLDGPITGKLREDVEAAGYTLRPYDSGESADPVGDDSLNHCEARPARRRGHSHP